ncbi:MAG: glycosyltransferase [Candidatus Methylacidiphilales bacterium]|nr:glycosyltransferase [Candidatus Methylacidiphilales bacterium]
MPRCDLQVHSRFSDRPSEWVLRKLGVPESYTDPLVIHQRLAAAGFDFITITDHNRIEGGLQILHLPGSFLSEEVTTYFPADGCKVHLLVWDITEAQHAEIQRLRSNIFELAAYLRAADIAHAVTHPLSGVNHSYTVEHFERLLLLFSCFETLNGNRDPLAGEVTAACLDRLTPEWIDRLADKHGLSPLPPEPWKKARFGSSDDHGGLYLGQTWTECAAAGGHREFLRAVMRGDGAPAGRGGDPLRFSNSIYNLVFSYASDRLGKTAPQGMKLVQDVARRFLEGKNPTHFSWGERLGHLTEAIRTGKAMDFIRPNDPSLNRELATYFLDPRLTTQLDRIIRLEPNAERRSFRMASKIANDLVYRLFRQVIQRIDRGELLESLQPATGMLPILAGVAPYVFSYHTLRTNRPLLRAAARGFLPVVPDALRNSRRAWFTDTLEDVNGVARTIRTMSQAAGQQGHDLTVVTCRSDSQIDDIRLKNFEPVGEFELPEYKLQKLSFPPVLDMIDYIDREGFTELIISTPGPVGMTAMAAGKLLGIPSIGIYHTDFPQYVRILTEDEMMETLMWSFMHWFYSQMDLVYVNSEFYRQCWIDRGFSPSRLDILPRGLDTELFNPKHRERDFWKKRGARHPVLLYVGRVSKEKELGFLVDIFKELRAAGVGCDLAVVGDGPYLDEMKQTCPEAIFTGILTGLELGRAYASADLFVFPSTTDTFGNVVIEAQAAGLPVLVSDVGGPRELVRLEEQGRVLPAGQKSFWVSAIRDLLEHPISRERIMSHVAQLQEKRSWDQAFRRFWQRTAS